MLSTALRQFRVQGLQALLYPLELPRGLGKGVVGNAATTRRVPALGALWAMAEREGWVVNRWEKGRWR